MNCPICGSNSSYVFDSKFYSVNRCLNSECEHLFAVNPQDGAGVCDYEDEDTEIYNVRNESLTEYMIKKNFLVPNTEHLDIGSGSGHIVRTLNKHGIKVTCIEPNDINRTRLKNDGFECYSDIRDIPQIQKFYSATMFEVIEHLANPVDILSQVKALLREEGRLFLSTPTGESYQSKKNNRTPYLYTYDIPEHIQFFTKKSLQACILRAGFSALKYERIEQMYPQPSPSCHKGLKPYLSKILNRLYYALDRIEHFTCFASLN